MHLMYNAVKLLIVHFFFSFFFSIYNINVIVQVKYHFTVSGVCKLKKSVYYLKIMHTFNNRMTSKVCFKPV